MYIADGSRSACYDELSGYMRKALSFVSGLRIQPRHDRHDHDGLRVALSDCRSPQLTSVPGHRVSYARNSVVAVQRLLCDENAGVKRTVGRFQVQQ